MKYYILEKVPSKVSRIHPLNTAKLVIIIIASFNDVITYDVIPWKLLPTSRWSLTAGCIIIRSSWCKIVYFFVYILVPFNKTYRNVPYFNVPHSGSFLIVHSSNWVGNNINRVNIKFLIMFHFVSAWSYVTTTEQVSKKTLSELRL